MKKTAILVYDQFCNFEIAPALEMLEWFTSRFPNIHNGIFLDVLAQDYTSNNAFLRKIHMKATASSRWLVLDKWRGTSVNANSRFSSLCANILRKIFPLGFFAIIKDGICFCSS